MYVGYMDTQAQPALNEIGGISAATGRDSIGPSAGTCGPRLSSDRTVADSVPCWPGKRIRESAGRLVYRAP